MKPLFALLLIFFSASVFANINQCESTNQQTIPSASVHPAPRIKHKVSAAPVIGPKLPLTPLKMERPFAKPAPVKISTVSRYDCLAPVSLPPGAIRIGYSTPYVGPRLEWGTPTPSYLATGPMPVYPGSPDDFHPAAYAPPSFVPPAPNELPEPPTVALMLLGAFLMVKKSRTHFRAVAL